MTSTPELDDGAAAGSWDTSRETLRSQFPRASDGILFCVYKLQQNADLTIPDFRQEAELHGIKLGGRAIHSAKVLLGWEKPSQRRSPKSTAEAATPRELAPEAATSTFDADVETSLIQAVKQIQDSATAESRRLREAMRRAVEILQRALDGREPD